MEDRPNSRKTLRISDISLENFRSYERFDLHDVGELTILSGPNASGKTNAIEALQLLTALNSFRNAKSAELVRQGEANGHAKIHVTDGSRQLDIELHVQDDSTKDARPSRQYVYNGKKRPSKDLRGILPSVTFTPDDLNLAKGSNRFRRHELDMLGSQVNANYYQLVRDYDKVLRQKNRLLKEEAPLALLEAADDVFQTVANQLTNYRRSLFERMVPLVAEYYGSFVSGGERFSATYVEGKDGDVSRAISIADESLARRTLAGPHLHSINFYINDLLVQDFASQGQQRSIVLAIKLAESRLIEEILHQLPVLLLDDVMSELDENRRSALVKELLEGKQTFITTANIDYFAPEMLEKATVVTFDNGKNR